MPYEARDSKTSRMQNLGYTYIVSPTLLSTTRLTVSHIRSVFQTDFPVSINDFGINNFGPLVGGVSISLQESGVSFSAGNKGTFTRTTAELLHDWTWIKGNHTITVRPEYGPETI